MPKKNSDSLLSFEELYSKLEATVNTLEGGNLTLDQALALYEQGIALAKQCSAMLDGAELRIQELGPVAQDFQTESGSEFPDDRDDE